MQNQALKVLNFFKLYKVLWGRTCPTKLSIKSGVKKINVSVAFQNWLFNLESQN